MPHFVKKLEINGVKARQIPCIELHGAPNAAVRGAVGVLGIDVDSPTREVYKCVAVNNNIFTWMPLSSGGSGKGIAKIEKTSSDGLIDTYTITFTDDTTTTFTVTNGAPGAPGAQGDDYVLTDTDKANIAGKVKALLTEENWTFTLEDGSTETKAVYVG